MKAGIKKINRTLFELWVGILIWGIAVQLILLALKDLQINSIGLWAGIGTALVSAFHMWRSLDVGLSLNEKDASSYMTKQYMLRYAAMVLVIALLAIAKVGNPLTAFVGIMGLKAAAYMQPFTKKISVLIWGEEVLPPIIWEDIDEVPSMEKVENNKENC